jgi:hypothetical protein
VDLYGPKGKERSHLAIVRVDQPELNPRVLEIGGGLAYGENGPGQENFGWSPSGRVIYAGGRVIDTESGKKCDLPWLSVFITDDLAIARDPEDSGPSRNWKLAVSHFTFFNSGCQPVARWEVPEEWAIADISPDRGLLSVSQRVQLPTRTAVENLIVDPLSRKVLQRWFGDSAPGGEFADSGKAICSGSDVEAAKREPATCWEVDSGKKIGEAPTINGGDPMASALHASRVVASDYRRRKVPLSSDIVEVFKRRVVWDFRSGKELVSWRPEFQSWDYQLELDPQKPLKHVHEPFRFAISPDGQYVVEGGNAFVHRTVQPGRPVRRVVSVFNFEGVRIETGTRGASDPLTDLLSSTSSMTRGINLRAIPALWSIETLTPAASPRTATSSRATLK